MAVIERIIAGDNIHLERRHNDVVIHCSHMPAPVGNLHGGFFCLKQTPEDGERLCVTMKNCVFKLNGKYVKLDDYKVNSFRGKYNLLFLQLSQYPEECRIRYLSFHDEEKIDFHFDDHDWVLLYNIIAENSRLRIERFASGGLIDTVLPGEGFLYAMNDGSINVSVTRTSYGDRKEFMQQGTKFYIPSFNPVTHEALNIELPSEKGGAVAFGKGENYYIWHTSGFPSSWSESYTVKINPEKIYI
jgi:hypothetical protein